MLKIISSKTRECYEEASSRAKRTEQAAVRKAYFELERQWLRLARSYDFPSK
jgi:ribosomal protein S21